MSFLVQGRGRRASKIGADDRELRLTTLESLAVAQFEPEYIQIAASGRRYVGGCQVIASGIAPVQVIPTTTATLALYNSDIDGGLSIAIDSLSFCLGSGTAAAGATLWACVTNGKVAAANIPSAAANYSSQVAGKKGNGSISVWGTAVTIPTGSAWFQATTSFQLAAANVGQGDQAASLKGIVVPPGYALGLGIFSAAGTTPLYAITGTWIETELDLEP